MHDHELRQLQRELLRVERGPGRRYQVDVKARMIAWARRAVAAGAGVAAAARELGVDRRALLSWLRDLEPASTVALVPVEIVEWPASTAGHLTVVSPAGYRLEGLTFERRAAATPSSRLV